MNRPTSHPHATPAPPHHGPPHTDPRWSPPPAGAWAQPSGRRSRLPNTAEALGWGGGLTTIVGVVAVTWDFWSQIPDLALVALLIAATAVLGSAAVVVGGLDAEDDGDQLAANLSVGLWWMTGIAAAFTCYIATDVLSGGRVYLALLAASLATTAMGAAAAHRTGRDSAAAGTVISAAVAAFAAASLMSLDGTVRAVAITVVGLCAAAGLLVSSGVLHQRQRGTRVTWATTMVLLLGSSQAVVVGDPDLLLLPVMAGLSAIAVGALVQRTRGEAITACLLAGLVTSQVAWEVAPDIFNLSTTVLLCGVAMTAGCIWLVRRAGAGGAGDR